MNLKPVRNNLVVEKQDDVKQTSSGLIIPTTVENKVSTGKVVAVGSGHLLPSGKKVKLELKVDDVVMFDKSYAVEIKFEEKTYLVLREEFVMCVVK